VQTLPRFERFFISHNLLDQEIAASASALIAQSASLKEIRINDNSLMGDDCGLQLAQALLQSRSIKVCHIAGTKISGKSATMLADVLRQSHTLKDLDISNNLIIMDDIELLANAFKESQIECLNIRGNIVSAEEIVAFEHLLMPVSTMTKRKFIF
jgi:Ran GTPase-activating protein (RanGAP) involved in mRNA processing and transport